MEAVSAFFMRNIVYVYFFYGLAFFALGLVVLLESGRTSEFRFARALVPLALFGLVHGAHEWFEMFQIFAAHEAGYRGRLSPKICSASFPWCCPSCSCSISARGSCPVRRITRAPISGRWPRWARCGWLPSGLSPGAINPASLSFCRLLTSWRATAWRFRARCWRRGPCCASAAIFTRGMSAYGQDLLWAALAFTIYGLAQIFTRPSLVFPSQTINTAFFLRTFGIPVQLLRGLAAVAIAITLGRALRAFEQEGRLRLARANKARIEAQAATLVAQQRRASEVEALNIQLAAGARELSALVEMSRILTSTVDRRRLLDNALYQIVHSFERASCSIIFLKRADGGLELAGEYRREQAPMPNNPPPLTAVAADAVTLAGPTGAGLDGVVRVLDEDALADGTTYRTLGAPLLTKGQVFGSLALTSVREEEPFGEPELRLLDAFAGQIATALENAQLYGVLQERETQLEELVRQLVDTQEQERARIARELHDETGQKLTALAMGLAAVESALPSDASQAQPLVRDLREVSDSAITELRRLMADLRPAQLDDLGLLPALRWYIGQYNGRHPELTVTLNAERLPKRLPTEHETVLFRAVQEALTNVARHAHATQVTIELHQEARGVRLTIGDNGMGFDVNTPPKYQRGSGLGLVGMRERVSLVGGTCAIESQRPARARGSPSNCR